MARPGFTAHRKFGRLVHLLGMPEPYVLGHLEFLWASSYENGEPVIGDSVDVELAAKWIGEPGKLTRALLECGGADRAGLIEPVEGHEDVYQIHDLFDHAPEYVRKRAERESQRRETGKSISDVRRAAAKARWKNAPNRQTDANGNHLHGVAFLHESKFTENGVPKASEADNCSAAKLSAREADAKKPPDFLAKDANECRLHANGRTPAPAPAPNTDRKAALFSTGAVDEDESPVVLTFPTVKGKRSTDTQWHLRRSLVNELATDFPGHDVLAIARAALAWVKANQSRRKTANGMQKFLTNWLLRAKPSNNGNGHVAGDDPKWSNRMSEAEADELFRRAGITGGES